MKGKSEKGKGKREEGNSRGSGSGLGFWQKISRKWENGLPAEIGEV
jgi:hypothetical protein